MPRYYDDGSDIRVQAERIVAGQRTRRDEAARTAGGVGWSAMHRDLPEVDSVEAVAAQLTETRARNAAFHASPRGRFLAAIISLEGDFHAEGAKLRGYYGRSLADEREPLNLDAVAGCLRVLAVMDDQRAQDAELALADLLTEAAPALKWAAE